LPGGFSPGSFSFGFLLLDMKRSYEPTPTMGPERSSFLRVGKSQGFTLG